MWKIIPNTKNNYSANDKTREIKSNDRLGTDGRKLKGKTLKPCMQNSGYLIVDLMVDGQKKKKLVHRLIAETFIENYSEDLDVNHIDCDKTNNVLSNLECITRAENLEHARAHGLVIASDKQIYQRSIIKDISRKLQSKAISMFDSQGRLIETFEAMADVKRKYGFDTSSISRAARGLQNTSYGYYWKWVES